MEAAALPRKVWKTDDQAAILDSSPVWRWAHRHAGGSAWTADLRQSGACGTEEDGFHAAALSAAAIRIREKEVRRSHIVLSLWNEFEAPPSAIPAGPAGGQSCWPGESRLYESRTGRPLEIEALHVGLEPAVFLEKKIWSLSWSA